MIESKLSFVIGSAVSSEVRVILGQASGTNPSTTSDWGMVQGLTNMIVLVAAQSTNSVTRTLNFYNQAAVLLYSITGLPDNATSALEVWRPIATGFIVGDLVSGVTGNNITDTLYIYSIKI